MSELTETLSDQFEFKKVDMKFEKKTIEEIITLSSDVNPDKAANEVLDWLLLNVTNFIDNKEKEFRIDLIIEENSSENMENIKLLQDLYRAIPDDSEFVDAEKIEEIFASGKLDDAFEDEDFKKLVACREALDNIVFEVHDKMRESDKLKELYEKMIYFYEMIGINEGQPLLKELEGEVDIIEFEYEAFSISVLVNEGLIDEHDNEVSEKKTITQYAVPEGFSILLEIAFIDKSRSFGIF